MKEGLFYVGTSGWQYKHWIGKFYPTDLKSTDQLKFYLHHLHTVELNSSFYHLPDAATFKKWRTITPDDFIFSVKATRYITHMKKLQDIKESLRTFLKNAKTLKEKLGPILFQLPPKWKLNVERLNEFVKNLPSKHRFVFEFRNETWYDTKVYEILHNKNCAFCIYELAGHQSPEIVTADFVYIRLHGPGEKYQGNYSDEVLKRWSEKILHWLREGTDVYIYFDNDQDAYAACNAQKLFTLIKLK